MIHKLDLKSENLHGSFSKDYQPILTLDSGDTLQLRTPDIEWGYSSSKNEERVVFESAVKEEDRRHPMIGPIAIRGAKPGMVCVCHIHFSFVLIHPFSF
ncbi:hypothetical protein V7152_27215 [Neobacillus drentensis]|uniref:hypothetical protein n=1 Tax=Neobacillus drentensis TaxID=220684 RepID=UPI002FFF2381